MTTKTQANDAPRPPAPVKTTPTEVNAARRAAWNRLWNRLLADPEAA